MNPLDFYTKPWTGWDKDDQADTQAQNSNPFLDQFAGIIHDQVHGMAHDAIKDYVCHGVLDEAVRRGMIDSTTAKAALPIMEFVYDRLDPCA